ncbi:MAG: hypothetical protein WCJ35_15610 [Planctomycetota bacterium]
MSDFVEDSFDSEMPELKTPETVTQTVCRQCFELLDIGDNFCRYCGGMTEVGTAMVKISRLPPPVSLENPTKPLSWTESPVVVLLGLFFLLGPLALPMLWRSRRFTRIWKIGLTFAVLLVTVAAFWYSAEVLMKAFEPLQELRRSGLI